MSVPIPGTRLGIFRLSSADGGHQPVLRRRRSTGNEEHHAIVGRVDLGQRITIEIADRADVLPWALTSTDGSHIPGDRCEVETTTVVAEGLTLATLAGLSFAVFG
jgi:hypothetical protein